MVSGVPSRLILMFCASGQPVRLIVNGVSAVFASWDFSADISTLPKSTLTSPPLLAIWQDSLIILPVKFSVPAARAVVTVARLKASSEPTTSRVPFSFILKPY